MRKFSYIAVLGLALAGMVSDASLSQPVGPPNEIWCNKTSFATGGPSVLPLVTGVTGRTVNICGWIISATAASTMFMLTGTGATCATNAASITAAHAIPAGAFMNYSSGNAWFSSASGAGVCANVGGTGPVQITIFYSQF